VLLIQCRGKIAVITAVNAILLHQCAIYIGTDCIVVSTRKRGKSGYDCNYCSTVTSVCYGYRD